jgi:hypothetical protein
VFRYDLLCFEGIAQALAIFQGKGKIPQYKLTKPVEQITLLPEVPQTPIISANWCRPRKCAHTLQQQFCGVSNSHSGSMNLSSLFRIKYTTISPGIELLFQLALTICQNAGVPSLMKLHPLRASNLSLSIRPRK